MILKANWSGHCVAIEVVDKSMNSHSEDKYGKY